MNIDKAANAAADTLVSCAGEPVTFKYIVASGISAREPHVKNALHEANGMIRAAVEKAAASLR